MGGRRQPTVNASRDPYEVLGVPRHATVRQIRAAYVTRARQLHPDLVGLRGLNGMRDLNEAWEILKDSARRSAFDAATGVAGAGGPASGAGSSRMDGDPNRPFWTGAMGPPPGRPWGHVLDWGIFAGWSLGEISRRDPGYLAWLRDRPESKAYTAELLRLLDPAGDEPSPKPSRGRWR